MPLIAPSLDVVNNDAIKNLKPAEAATRASYSRTRRPWTPGYRALARADAAAKLAGFNAFHPLDTEHVVLMEGYGAAAGATPAIYTLDASSVALLHSALPLTADLTDCVDYLNATCCIYDKNDRTNAVILERIATGGADVARPFWRIDDGDTISICSAFAAGPLYSDVPFGWVIEIQIPNVSSTGATSAPAPGPGPTAPDMLTLTPYAIAAGSGVTNTGASVIDGDLALDPGSAVVGFPPGVLTGTEHVNDAEAIQAKADLVTLYDYLDGLANDVVVAGDIGGQTLSPGVYTSATSIGITGTLTLDAGGDAAAVFVIRAGTTIITAPSAVVVLTGGAQAANVFWLVGSSATLDSATVFQGTIVALTSITLVTDATIVEGRALARNGAVTLDTNLITAPGEPIATTPVTLTAADGDVEVMWEPTGPDRTIIEVRDFMAAGFEGVVLVDEVPTDVVQMGNIVLNRQEG